MSAGEFEPYGLAEVQRASADQMRRRGGLRMPMASGSARMVVGTFIDSRSPE